MPRVSNEFGELFLEAGLVNSEQLAKSVQRSFSTGLPVGRIMVLSHCLADSVWTTALEIQVRIRDGVLTRHEALGVLRLAAAQVDRSLTQEESFRLHSFFGPHRTVPRLGELMVMAGLLDGADVLTCLELGLKREQMIGQALVSQGYISPELVEVALELQNRIRGDGLEPTEAARLLARGDSKI